MMKIDQALAPAGQIVAADDVAEDLEDQHDEDEEHEEPEERPENFSGSPFCCECHVVTFLSA